MGNNSLVILGIIFCSWLRGSTTSADCTTALGMQSGIIRDKQITASSQSHAIFFKPSNARLNCKQGRNSGGWCADVTDQNPYLQIDLLSAYTITALATQGGHNNWIEKYSLSFSYDNISWFNHTAHGIPMIFSGNSDDSSIVWNNLTRPLTARVLRIHPLVVDKAISPCVRLEVYGCKPYQDCKKPVGVEDGTITNQQMTASSSYEQFDPSNGRLNNKRRIDSKGKLVWGGWCTDKLDLHQFLQVDLGWVRSVSGVATQGLDDMDGNFVSQYKLNFSTDGSVWKSYMERPSSGSKVFQGNWDKDTVVTQILSRKIFARFIRFNPVSWEINGYICLRVEIYECLPAKGSVPLVSPPSETLEMNRTSSVNLTCIVSGQPGFHMNWYKNRVVIPSPPLPPYVNGSVKSVLTLNRVKYKDRGSIISCTAWYPTVSINTTRHIHLHVHAPRLVIRSSEVQARQVQLHIRDPTPAHTATYLVRYKTNAERSQWMLDEHSKVTQGGHTLITVQDLHPYTAYVMEVASYYKDQDQGPYSFPQSVITKQAVPSGPPRDVLVLPRGKDTIKVLWSIPSAGDRNGVITKYEIILYKQNGVTQTYPTKGETLYKDIGGLEPNQQYFIGVRAYTRVGPGPYSRNLSHSTEISGGSQLTVALEKLNKVSVTPTTVIDVIKEVRNITSKSSKLVQKDLSITVNILDKVVKTNVTSPDVGDHMLGTLSHVMDAKPEALQNIQQENNRPVRFVRILEDYIDKGGKFSEDTSNIAVITQPINQENNNVDVSIKTSVDKIVMNLSANSTSENSEASITARNSLLNANGTDNFTLIVVYYRTSKLFAPDYRSTEVCKGSYTAQKLNMVERPKSSSYTMENATGSRVTESSPVLSTTLRNKRVANLTTPLIIKFKMPHDQVVKTRCVWWNFQKGGWSTAGCSLRGIVNDTIICECDHMTNFAALVDIDGPSSKACGEHSKVLSLISYVGCVLSILGLSLTIITFGLFRKLRNDQIAAKILLHLCASLLCVLIVFVSGVERGSVSEDACRIVAALVHYFLLVAFLWMLIEAYFMYQAFVKVFRDYGDYVMWKCSALGWGLPFIVVVVTIAVDKTSYGGKHYCRLGNMAFYAAFVAPVVFVMFINTIVFLLIMYKLATRPQNAADPDRGSEGLLKIKRAFGILILVGITWIFGFFAVADARLVFHYLFAICNSLQGFSIFLFYCVIQKKVRECWWALLTCNLRTLEKSKSMYLDSYDRRRLSSASRIQLDAMRTRSNTVLSQILPTPLHRAASSPPDVVLDCHHHSNIVYDDDQAHGAITFESLSDYQLADLYESQSIEIEDSTEELPNVLSHMPGSRSPSLLSQGTPSRNASVRSSRASAKSVQSTPKMLRLPHIHALRPVRVFKTSPENLPHNKETLKRTASHTPDATRPTMCSLLRRTKSASGSLDDLRQSVDLSISSDQTSCESLSLEGCNKTKKHYLRVPVDNLGAQILGPLRGSVRGFVGYVETTVENFDLLIDLERQRTLSRPCASSPEAERLSLS